MEDKDIKHLTWIYERLIHVHKENPNYDYMIRLKQIVDESKDSSDISKTLIDFCQSMQCQFIHDHQISISEGVIEYLKSINAS